MNDKLVRDSSAVEPDERAAGFDRLRKEYPVRREFAASTVIIDSNAIGLGNLLRGIGFAVAGG